MSSCVRSIEPRREPVDARELKSHHADIVRIRVPARRTRHPTASASCCWSTLRPTQSDGSMRVIYGTSPPRKCCPAANGARHHGQRKSSRSARDVRARAPRGFTFIDAAVPAKRPADFERRTGTTSQQPLLTSSAEASSFVRHARPRPDALTPTCRCSRRSAWPDRRARQTAISATHSE